MIDKLNEYIFFITGLIVTAGTYIYKRWNHIKEEIKEIQTYNAVNTSQHKDFKEDMNRIESKVDSILDHLINNKK